jgi:hypothetical protein
MRRQDIRKEMVKLTGSVSCLQDFDTKGTRLIIVFMARSSCKDIFLTTVYESGEEAADSSSILHWISGQAALMS